MEVIARSQLLEDHVQLQVVDFIHMLPTLSRYRHQNDLKNAGSEKWLIPLGSFYYWFFEVFGRNYFVQNDTAMEK